MKSSVVKNDFPIVQEGILEADFSCDAALINYLAKLVFSGKA